LKIKLDGSSGKGPNSARIAELRKQLDEIKEYGASFIRWWRLLTVENKRA